MQRVNTAIGFSEREVEYLMAQRLGRIATVSPDQQPHVVPIVYEFDGTYFYFSGWRLKNSLKFRNIQLNSKLALVVDDFASANPWSARGIEVRGIAEPVEKEGYLYVRVTPLSKASWGL